MPEEPEDNMDANQEALVINKGELLLQHQQQQHQQHTHHVPPLVHQVNPSASTIAGHSLSSTTSPSSSYLTQRKPKRSIGVVEPRVVVKLRVPNKDEQDKDLKKAGHSVGPRTTTTTMTTMTAKKSAAKNKSIVSGQRPNHSSMSDGSVDVEHEHHSSGLTSGKSRKRERRPLEDDIHRKRGHNEEGEDDDDNNDATQEQKASIASSRLELELGPNQIRKAKKPRIAPSTHLEDNHHQLVLNRLSITKTLPEHFKRALERRRESSILEPNEKPSLSKTPNATRNCQVRLQKLDVCQYDDENESDRHLQHQTPPPPPQQQRPSSRSSNQTSSGDEDSDDSEKSAFIQHSQSLPTFSDLAAAFQECNQKESRRKRVSNGTTGNISALTIAKRSEKEGRESECGHDGTAPMSSCVAERPASSSLQQSGPPVRRGRSKSSERDRSAITISGSDTGKKSTETRRVWEDKENARNNPNYYATHLPSQKVDEANNIETSPDKPTKAIKIPPTFCQLSLENVVFTKRAPKVSSSQRVEASHVSLTNVADSSCSTDTNVSSPRKTWPALPGRKKRTQGSSLSTKRNERGAQRGPTEQDKQEKVHVEEKMPEQHVHVPEAQDMSSGHFPATVATPCESGTTKYVPNSTTIGKHVSLNQDYETLFSPIESLQGHHEDLTSSAMSLNDSGKSSEGSSNLLDMPLLDELGQSHMSDWHDFVSNPQRQNGSPSSSPDNHQTEGTQSRNDGYLKAVSPHKILSDTRGSSAPSQMITPTPDGADKVNVFSSQALLKRRREARTVSKSDMATQAVEEDISSPTDQDATADTIKNASRPTVTPTIAKETRAPKKKTRPQFTFAKEPQSQWMYCDIESCNFWTRKPERMKRHKLCHTSGHHKNFECPDCGLRFYSLPKMLKHDRKKHTGIKDYECRLCGAEVSDIGVHMRVHYEPNSHPCKICALKFKHRNSLVRHMCQHTGEQFRCGRCEAVYVSLEELNQHIRREHPHSDEAQENQIIAAAMSESEDSDDPPTPMEQHRTKSPPVVMEISVPKAPLPKIPISRMPNTRRNSPKVTMSRKATQMRTTNALNGFQTSIVAQSPQISAMSNSGAGQYALAFPGTTATPILVDCNGFVLQNLTWDGQNQFQTAPSHQQTHHQPQHQQQQPPVQYFQSINGAVSQGGLQFASQPQSYFSFGNQIYSTSVPFPQDSLSNGPQGILEIPHEGFTIPVQDNQIKFEIIDTPTLESTMTRPALKENPVDIAMKEIMDIHVVSIEDNEIQEIAKEPLPSVHTLSTHENIVDDDNDDDDDDDEVMILEMPSSHTARQEPITRSIKSEPITFPEKDDQDKEVMSSKTRGSEHPASQMNSFQENARKEPIKEKSGLEPPKLTIEGNSVQHQLESFSSKLKELRNGFGASSPYPSSSSSSSPSSFAAPSYSFSSGRRVEEEKGHGSAQSKSSLATRENKDLVDPSPPKKQEYKCEKCSRIYKYLEFLKVHQKRCSA
ncbi:uncharacterized protein LOC131881010 [Tigriopus californicus]|uniref:uncharacterized protein LOC131881010 n=1 Tax=Tigriopus californicus TaxID=6832 RepID=UPI0027DAA2F7|nr:uncharacterized protein LOC131881010 [Tigriopus californicus]|eukprot:TCALIF_02684-PA protein Name:"Similar to E4f1 Transcription factor E4F1 (Mus musculus)" AED:0.33 eAED:0.33 QI:0/1/0/1/1/0.5/2/0/1484